MQKEPLKEQTDHILVLPLDEKDKAILRYLQSNAKATVREIADQCASEYHTRA